MLDYKYEFDDKTGILFKYHYGEVNIKKIIDSWEYARKNDLIHKGVKGIVIDFRNTDTKIERSEYKDISHFFNSNLDLFGGLKIAIITIDDPKNIIVPILVSNIEVGYKSRPFLTLEGAVKWILE
jgi:hypothetical protein